MDEQKLDDSEKKEEYIEFLKPNPKRKKIVFAVVELMIIIIVVLAVAKINYDNGRISMCEELGGKLVSTSDKSKPHCLGVDQVKMMLEKNDNYIEGVDLFKK